MIDLYTNICQGSLDLNTCGQSAADIIKNDDETLQDIGIETTLSTVEYGQPVTTPTPETPIDITESKSITTEVSKSSNSTSSTASTTSDSFSSSKSYSEKKEKKLSSLPQRYAQSIARSPTKHLSVSIILSIIIIAIILIAGDFQIEVGNKGLLSRATLIADRSTQQLELRNVMTSKSEDQHHDNKIDYCDGSWYGSESMLNPHSLNFNIMFKTSSPAISALDADSLYEMCAYEEATLDLFEQLDTCFKCQIDESSAEEKCLQPYSLVGYARIYLNFLNGITDPEYLIPTISCDSLRSKWTAKIQSQFVDILRGCTKYTLQMAKIEELKDGDEYASCPLPIMPATLVDKDFLQTDIVRFTSSIFATKNDKKSIKAMYNAETSDQFSASRPQVSSFEGVYFEVGVNSLYSTGKQGFYELYLNEILPKEALISVLAVIVTSLCILFHTRSLFLTLLGLLQIVLALPWAYFVYRFICGLSFFPFVNINALFIVFALGADDIFVVVDRWKLKRLEHPDLSTEEVAIIALPEAAYATFVTSITTSIAFLASAIIRVPAVSLFSIYCGLVIALDYILCILLVFPALCLYDVWLCNGSNSCLLRFGSKQMTNIKDEYNKSWAAYILSFHYNVIHKLRWIFLLASIGVIVLCSFVALRLSPPESPDQPFLPESNPFEIHRVWHRELLASSISKGNRGLVNFIWGLLASDTGDRFNPNDISELVYDSSFQPGLETTQSYLLEMCDTIFNDNLVRVPEEDYSCVMKQLNSWLNEQSQLTNQTLEEYSLNCQSSKSIPMSEEAFESCLIAYTRLTNNTDVLYEQDTVKVITIQGRSNSTLYSPFDEQELDWYNMESWYESQMSNIPDNANFFATSQDFWAYDTFSNSMSSAYKSALIALACASAMILLTSHSLSVMIFSAISIGYVLVASTASLVGLGWSLGTFESILFGILIGVGVDFVLHFGHAYTLPAGNVSKEVRTRRALMEMGPSVMASAFTTLSTALMMLAAENLFIYKFAVMLIMVVVHSSIGSFIIFLVLCECFGPSESTVTYRIKDKLCSLCKRDNN